MADDKTPPPPQDFSELVTQWERNFNEFSNQMMGTEEFTRSMNQFQNMQMGMQRQFSEVMARQLANFNMPSRDDVIGIGEHLAEIDQRLMRIEKALEKTNAGLESAPRKKSGPARTKKPPAKKKAAAKKTTPKEG